MKKLIDYMYPNNCRLQLRQEAEKNVAACIDALAMIKQNGSKFSCQILHKEESEKPKVLVG